MAGMRRLCLIRATFSIVILFIFGFAAAAGADPALPEAPKLATTQPHFIAPGPFEPNWDSLARNYKCPLWFRDAKFGIWAHWSAQCVPEQGDWYARKMYIQGQPDYDYQVANYGHPSQFGFKDIDNLWHAEHWDPERLMQLYIAAGAKYFVALASHHDNFDCFDSKYHEWNSVRVGPHKDIVGTWEKVAREHGLHFGVSNHSAHAWHWLQVAYGYDAVGPLAGVRYDGFLTKADGKGKWWDGLDPQELYTGPNMVMPAGLKTIAEIQKWHDDNDRIWNENPPPNNPWFTENWFLRAQDLVDKYHPDLVYLDDRELPLGQTGLDFAAHYYNSNIANHGGKLEAVLDAKHMTTDHRPGLVPDFERSINNRADDLPWQTDTCIGEWHYHKGIKYKSVDTIVHMLLDIVSKNGNLLLSIPLRGDGTIDDDELTFLQGMAAWMKVNSEGIYGTRPWKIYGEGPTRATTSTTGEKGVKYSPDDIRFTSKDGCVYAYVLGIPSHDVKIKSLGIDAGLAGAIAQVNMLGSDEQIVWHQEGAALVIQKPAAVLCQNAIGFKVTFK
jgi:alpha-L-fucosidase